MNGHTSTSVTTQLSGLCNVILILNDSRLPIYVCSVIASYTFCLLLLGTYYVSAVFKPPIILPKKYPSNHLCMYLLMKWNSPRLFSCSHFCGDVCHLASAMLLCVEREGPFLARRHLSSFSEVRTVVMYGRLQFFFGDGTVAEF